MSTTGRDTAARQDQSIKRRRLKLPPELGDGQHTTIVDPDDVSLVDILQSWAEESEVGDRVTIEIVEMSDEEVDALPSI